MPDISDADLVRRALAGGRSAFEELLGRYWERLYMLAVHSRLSSADAEDAVQEALVQAYRRLSTLRDPERFGSWLYKIAMRTFAAKAAAPSPAPSVADAPASGDGPAEETESAESRRAVREAVASLPDHYRLPVTLRFFDGMSCDEIASHLGEPVGTVWTRLHRANAILRGKLGFLSPDGDGGGI